MTSYSLVSASNVSEEPDTYILWVEIVNLLINSCQKQIFIFKPQLPPYSGSHGKHAETR